MEDIRKLLNDLRQKVIRTTNHIQIIESENINLKTQVVELDSKIKDKNSEIDQLKRQLEAMKIAGVLNSESSDKGSKQKIAELVREIDYCITLLK